MALDPTSCLMIDDDILNFSLDDEHNPIKPPSSSSDFSKHTSQDPDDCIGSFSEFAEEELEWLSNKDAFPAVETCFDMLPNPVISIDDHHSPISVLENSTSTSHSNSNSSSNGTITSCCNSLHVPISYPVKKRSKRRRRRRRGFPELPSQQCWWWNQVSLKKPEVPLAPPPAASGIGRRCQHCLAEKTPQWRAGPMGPKTLCNACGVRYKSGRLVAEYRPANSPTFSSVLHSNSHRKIMEMRKQKQDDGGGTMVVKKACGYGVG